MVLRNSLLRAYVAEHVQLLLVFSAHAFFLPVRSVETRVFSGSISVFPHPARVKFSKADHLCRGCGNKIIEGSNSCGQCAVISATERFIDAARVGPQTANGPKAQLKRADTQRRNALAQHAWNPSDQPAWLTETFYAEKIQPLLVSLSASVIARHISVSRWYAGRLREGYRPHPRHWQALAELAGFRRVLSGEART